MRLRAVGIVVGLVLLAGCMDQPLPGLGGGTVATAPGQVAEKDSLLQKGTPELPVASSASAPSQSRSSILITGMLLPVAGNGKSAFFGDGTLATAASLSFPTGLTLGEGGVLFVSDSSNQRIRRIAADGVIDTLADCFDRPSGITIGSSGEVFVADTGSNAVKRTAQDGATAPLITQSLNSPQGVAVDKQGNLYVADSFNNRILKITGDGIQETFAGSGEAGFSGDSGQANSAQLNHPWGLTIDSAGNLYVADAWNHRIRVIRTNGIIETVAGSGPVGEDKQGFAGDGGKATEAILNKPVGVALDHKGNLFICDMDNTRIRVVRSNGIIETVAGGGSKTGDNIPATEASLIWPQAIAVDKDGNLYIADSGANRIYKVVFQ